MNKRHRYINMANCCKKKSSVADNSMAILTTYDQWDWDDIIKQLLVVVVDEWDWRL